MIQADHNLAASSEFQRISDLGRWVDGRPPMYPGCRSAVEISLKRKAHRDGKRMTTADVPLAECLSGHELVTAFENGAFAYALRQCRKAHELPDVELQKRIGNGAAWKLRGPRLVLCGWIAFAMVVCKRRGLVASHRELARVLELRDPDWVSRMISDLRAWGLVAQDATWDRHGLACSRRANVLRLTGVGAHVFGLDVELAGVRLPMPEHGVRAQRARGIARAHAPVKTPEHPESTPEISGLGAIAISVPGGERGRKVDGPGAAAPAAELTLPSALPGGSLGLPSQDPGARPAALPTGFVKPGIPQTAAGELGPLVERVLPHDPASGSRATSRRDRALLREQKQRQNELREQLERRERERAEQAPPAPPAEPADSWAEVAAAAAAADRRAELERYRASLVHPPRMNRPVRDPLADELDMLETLERSNAIRGCAMPLDLAARLAELRRVRRGGS